MPTLEKLTHVSIESNEYHSNSNISKLEELNKLRLDFNTKVFEIREDDIEYTQPITFSEMIFMGGEKLRSIFIAKWDSAFKEGLLKSLNNNKIDEEALPISYEDKEEISFYFYLTEHADDCLCNECLLKET
ncbi:MAG: hypothetical protein NTV66_10220 [Methylococcales bacterium]|nr:hypothetical protein [Methylococcales bacterium]